MGAAEKAAAASAAAFNAPPAYEVEVGSEKAHPMIELFQARVPVQDEGFYPPANSDLRCNTCFDLITSPLKCGKAIKSGSSVYHIECWQQSAAPYCSYCAKTLLPHPELSLTGYWGEYRGKRYHLECYQYYAGPRCCICFDVIFQNPERQLSGLWRTLRDGSLIHEECFQKRGPDPNFGL